MKRPSQGATVPERQIQRQLIAQGSFTMVERCECGAMYLTIGPVCMKLDPRAIPELRETIAQAARALGLDRQTPQAPLSPVAEDAAGDEEPRDLDAPGRGHSCDIN